jgi:hypothetical protein
MNRTVVVDVDGVLANFNGRFTESFGQERQELEFLESRYPNQAREITRFVNDPATYKNLRPISLGLAVVELLNEWNYDVSIITSRPIGTEWITRRWLKEHNVNYLSFGVYPSKVSKISEIRPVCAIDDMPSISRHLQTYNIPVLLMQQPWNWYFENKQRIFSNINQFMTCFEQIIAIKEKK